MKKILLYLSIVFGFILVLFNADKVNILAYSESTSLGSYPAKIDMSKYYNINLFNYPDYNISLNRGQLQWHYIATSLLPDFVEGERYTIKSYMSSEGNFTCQVQNFDYHPCSGNYSFTFTYNGSKLPNLRFGSDNLNIDINFKRILLMVVKGDTAPTQYSEIFKFGYNVHFNVSLNNSSNSSTSAGVGLYLDNTLVKSKNCTIPANGSDLCSNNGDLLFLPFDIDSSGNISFNKNLKLFAGPSSSISIKNGGIMFEPYFRFTTIDNYNPLNLYLKNSYMYNSIFLSGFSVSSNENSKITFIKNAYDDPYDIYSNNTYNIISNHTLDIQMNDSFPLFDYLYSYPIDSNYNSRYSFAVYVPEANNGYTYNISISSLSLKILDNSSTTTPLPDNEITEGKYNECSAWYDIPCQLGNAITYVIYEAPIISPIINFFDGLIEPIKQFIRLIDQFSGFGILFGLGITAMLICIIKKMYGGSDG